PIGGGRPHDELARRPERSARGGAKFDPFLAEQDENTLGGRGEGGKFKLQAAGHEGFSPFDSPQKWKPVLRAQSSLRRLRGLFCGCSRKDVKRARIPRPARTTKGLRHPLDGRGRTWRKRFQALPPGSTLRAYEDFPRQSLWPPRHTIQINVLLCILKGFALAKPLCCRIK